MTSLLEESQSRNFRRLFPRRLGEVGPANAARICGLPRLGHKPGQRQMLKPVRNRGLEMAVKQLVKIPCLVHT